MDSALDAQEVVFMAQATRGVGRAQALSRADDALNRLRLYLRLAHPQHQLERVQGRLEGSKLLSRFDQFTAANREDLPDFNVPKAVGCAYKSSVL